MKDTSRQRPVDFQAKNCVLVHIEGVNTVALGRNQQDKVKDDGGLIDRLLTWCWASGIKPLADAPTQKGHGVFRGVYSPEDAAKISEWLREQGARER